MGTAFGWRSDKASYPSEEQEWVGGIHPRMRQIVWSIFALSRGHISFLSYIWGITTALPRMSCRDTGSGLQSQAIQDQQDKNHLPGMWQPQVFCTSYCIMQRVQQDVQNTWGMNWYQRRVTVSTAVLLVIGNIDCHTHFESVWSLLMSLQYSNSKTAEDTVTLLWYQFILLLRPNVLPVKTEFLIIPWSLVLIFDVCVTICVTGKLKKLVLKGARVRKNRNHSFTHMSEILAVDEYERNWWRKGGRGGGEGKRKWG